MAKNRANAPTADNGTDRIVDSQTDEPIVWDTVTPDNNGVNMPYDARWITIRDAANLAAVTSQTVRNAYKVHPAFNTPGATDADPAAAHWFQTKMVDQFGNTTDYDVVYIDHAAVLRWIDARAAQPVTGNHSGAKRYIVRLTDAQVALLQSNGDGELPSLVLPDMTSVKLEKPPTGTRKPKDAAVPTAATTTDITDNAQDGVAADVSNVQQADLFDVELTEEEFTPA